MPTFLAKVRARTPRPSNRAKVVLPGGRLTSPPPTHTLPARRSPGRANVLKWAASGGPTKSAKVPGRPYPYFPPVGAYHSLRRGPESQPSMRHGKAGLGQINDTDKLHHRAS